MQNAAIAKISLKTKFYLCYLSVLIGIRVVSVMALDFEIRNALEIEFDV